MNRLRRFCLCLFLWSGFFDKFLRLAKVSATLDGYFDHLRRLGGFPVNPGMHLSK